MSFYGLAGGSSIGTLFGTSSYGNTANNMSFLSDYAAIKSGSYYKLMKAYYGGNNKIDPLVSNGKTATSKDSAKKLTSVENSADSLKNAADALYKQGSKSVFKQIDIEQEDGTKEKGYDVNAIYKKVSQFVDSYNGVLDSTDNVSSDSLERSVKNLRMVTKANSRLLSDIGIGIKSDGSLTLDKEIFEAADMGKVKELFNGTGSYGYQVSARASMIDYAAQREAAKANTYNKYGAYSSNYNYSYNGYI